MSALVGNKDEESMQAFVTRRLDDVIDMSIKMNAKERDVSMALVSITVDWLDAHDRAGAQRFWNRAWAEARKRSR